MAANGVNERRRTAGVASSSPGASRKPDETGWFSLQRQWVLLLACVMVSIGISWAYTANATPMYRANVQILLSARLVGDEPPEDVVAGLSQGASFSSARAASYAVLATSSQVLGPVIQEIAPDVSEAELRARVTAVADATTGTMAIAVDDPDPILAANAANRISVELARLVSALESSNAAGQSPVDVRVIRRAVPATVPIWPRMDFNLAVGLVAGLVVGVGLSTMRDQLDTKLRGEQQVFEVAMQPPLASLPSGAAGRLRRVDRSAVEAARAQAMTRVRLKLGVGISADAPVSLLVTAPRTGAGGSAVATALAGECARAGLRALVVDCDLRSAGLTEEWGLTAVAGLTDAIFGLVAPDGVAVPGPDGLSLVAAGRTVPNPVEMLGSSAMAELLQHWSHWYDLVVLVGGPLVGMADTLTIVPSVDGVLCVVRDGATRRADLAEAIALVGAVRGTIVGVVLEGARGERAGRWRTSRRPGDARVPA